MLLELSCLGHLAVATARDDGRLVERSAGFTALAGPGDTAQACLQLAPNELVPGVDAQKRLRPAVVVRVRVSRVQGHLLLLEVVDESDRVRAEEQFTWILESSFDGFWDWHIKDDYEYMSPQFWRMFGYEPHEKEHKPSAWQDMVNQDDLKEALVNFAKHVETRGEHPYLQEVRYTHKDGSTVWVRCKGRVVEYDDQGGAVRMVGTHTDITRLKEQHAEERKLVEVIEGQNKRLQRRADEMHDLVYRANAPVIGFDTAGRVTEWNHRVAELTGKEEDDVVGTQLASMSICSAESASMAERILESAMEGKPIDNLRLSLQHATDQEVSIDLLANLSVRWAADGMLPTGGFLLGQDLTKVVLAKEDAVRAEAQARTEKQINEYMSHEVRNPIFAAQAGMDFLREFLDAEPVRSAPGAEAAGEDAQLVSNSLDAVAELLTNMQDLNKLLAGALPCASRLVDFETDVVAPVVAQLRRRCRPGVTLEVDCEQWLRGYCDEARMRQMLLGIGSNSLKFTHQGFVRLQVRAEGDDLVVRIADTGAGTPLDAPKTFSHAPGHGQGSSIGLCLARLVMVRIGGELWLDKGYRSGLEGRPGSCFCLRFPFRTEPENLTAFASMSEASSEVKSRPLGHEPVGSVASAPMLTEPGLPERNEDAFLELEEDDESHGARCILVVDTDEAARGELVRALEQALPEFAFEQASNVTETRDLGNNGRHFDVVVVVSDTAAADCMEAVRSWHSHGALIVEVAGEAANVPGADLILRKPLGPAQDVRRALLHALVQ